MKILGLASVLLAATVGTSHAATSSAFASVSMDFEAFAVDPVSGPIPANMQITGDQSISSSAVVDGTFETDSDAVLSTITVTNTLGVDGLLQIGWFAEVFAESAVDPDGPLSEVYYDSNAFVSLTYGSAFAATTGNYVCSQPDSGLPGYNCFGDFEASSDVNTGFLEIDLLADETLTINLEARTFATVQTTFPAAVPLPASGLLFFGGLAALAGWRRAQRQKVRSA